MSPAVPSALDPRDPHGLSPDDLLTAIDATLWLARNLDRISAPLTTSQFRIMRRAAAGGERSARLAERLAVRKPTVTAIADGLVSAGLLLRETDPADRRAIRLELTAAGRLALDETERMYVERFGELLGDTAEPNELLRLLVDLEDGRIARLSGGTAAQSTSPPGRDASNMPNSGPSNTVEDAQ